MCCWLALMTGCATPPPADSPPANPLVSGAVVSGDIPRLHLHLVGGGSPDQRDEKGRPLLVSAAAANQVRAVEMLLAHGADPTLAGPDGETAPDAAWRQGAVDVFRVFLEKEVDVSAVSRNIEALGGKDIDPGQRRIRDMISEAALYRSIIQHHGETPLTLLDRYLSLHPDGIWSAKVQEILLRHLEEDVERLGSSTDPAAWKSLSRRYGELGTHRFVVNAATLNVRRKPQAKAEMVGRLTRGERVHVAAVSGEWVDIGTGWVHRRYLSPDPVTFAFLKPHLDRAARRFQAAEGQTPVKRSRSASKVSEEVVPSPLSDIPPQEKADVPRGTSKLPDNKIPPSSTSSESPGREVAERDFEAVMSTPTLPLLEAFILKYAKDARVADLVERARSAYKDRILER